MACEIGSNIVVCGPPRTVPAGRHIEHCPLCDRRRRMVTRFDGVYYGTTTYCLACNGCEQDGDWRAADPDGRYAEYNRKYIRELWDTGVPLRKHQSIRAAFVRAYWEESE